MSFSWNSLKKPFFILAPMEDVTDTVFRRIVASCAAPDVFFTEFTNCDGMQSSGRKAVEHRLRFDQSEHPMIAQVWGIHPENYVTTVRETVDMGFDGVDINMGCPERSVTGHGACSALIKNPSLAAEIIAAAKEGANGKIPVSVKTRIGFSEIVTEEWISFLLNQKIDALTVHGRTAAEMSAVPCHWDEIGKAVQIRNSMKCTTPIIGNGDVRDRIDGMEKIRLFGVDGIMIGRGIFENLWAFSDSSEMHSPHEYMSVMKRHIELYGTVWQGAKSFNILKKFFKIYVRGFEGASQWRAQVMEAHTAEEVYAVIERMENDPNLDK